MVSKGNIQNDSGKDGEPVKKHNDCDKSVKKQNNTLGDYKISTTNIKDLVEIKQLSNSKLGNLLQYLNKTNYKSLFGENGIKQFVDKIVSNDGKIFVAEKNDDIIGSIAFHVDNNETIIQLISIQNDVNNPFILFDLFAEIIDNIKTKTVVTEIMKSEFKSLLPMMFKLNIEIFPEIDVKSVDSIPMCGKLDGIKENLKDHYEERLTCDLNELLKLFNEVYEIFVHASSIETPEEAYEYYHKIIDNYVQGHYENIGSDAIVLALRPCKELNKQYVPKYYGGGNSTKQKPTPSNKPKKSKRKKDKKLKGKKQKSKKLKAKRKKKK